VTDNISIQTGTIAFSELFTEAAWLGAHLHDPTVRVIEVDVSRAAYDQGHISGAILWNIYADLRHSDYSLLGRGEFEELLSRSGLTPQDTLVFYGYGSYLGFWLMKSHGHEHVLMLQGTRQDWRDGGMSWTAEVPRTDTSVYPLSTGEPALLISQRELQGALGAGDP
jgi:thiosulfate/3-mercaptopyruvate sulfurtransferase